MTNRVLQWVFIAVFVMTSPGVSGDTQDLPKDIKIGAQFLWELANVGSVSDIGMVGKSVTLNWEDEEFIRALGKVHASLRDTTKEYEPYILMGLQESAADQAILIYVLFAGEHESHYVKLGISGRTRPPQIFGIEKLERINGISAISKNNALRIDLD